jgi:isoleucyl-tRNA synthetase
MTVILDAMARLLAPILTFTAEEIWSALPAWDGKAGSVHLAEFPKVDPALLNPELGEHWKSMIAVKGEIAKALELARKNKTIGHSLDARVRVATPESHRPLLESRLEDLRSLLIVSQIELVGREALDNPFESQEIEGLAVGVVRSAGTKCHRCWNYSETVGSDLAHPDLCDRCRQNLP